MLGRGVQSSNSKKEYLSEYNNWRGITSFICFIILQRITTAVDKLLCQDQAGFRKGKSYIKHINVLRQIIEQSHEWNSSLYVVFVDFEKAFDSLYRPSLWKILSQHGMPQKSVNIFQALYEKFECRVIQNNVLTEPFRVVTGVKQGCILSPVLFSMAVDWLMRTATQGRCQGIWWTLMTVQEYLDQGFSTGVHMDLSVHAIFLRSTDKI